MKRFRNSNDSEGSKRVKLDDDNDDDHNNEMNKIENIKTTKDAIDYLMKMFPKKHLNNLPPIIYKHQLYAIIKNRTIVDRDLNDLNEKYEIKLFKFDDNEDVCICYTCDLINYLDNLYANNKKNYDFFKQFIDNCLKKQTSFYISKDDLFKKHKFNDAHITLLIQNGLLTIKDASWYYFSIPNISIFRKVTIDARGVLKFIISKKKYRELNLEELKERNIKKLKQFGILYHCYDMIGNDSVRKVDSPIGFIIRLNEGI